MDTPFLNIFKCTLLENSALVKQVTRQSTLQMGARFYTAYKPVQ